MGVGEKPKEKDRQPIEAVKRAIEMTREEKFEEALSVFEAQLPKLTEGDLEDKRTAAGAFSYYGLCMAMARQKYTDALNYCNVSLRSNSYDAEHYYNLALVCIWAGDRRKAVKALRRGEKLKPRHKGIRQARDELGRRRPPVLQFLSRSNPINIWLGKKRAEYFD
jgi:tetratricopeptide (TPR) repeat protein